MYIKGKRTDAVLVPKDDWEAMKETQYINAIPGMAASIFEEDSSDDASCVIWADLRANV